MRKLTNVTCGDQYTDAATLADVIDSSGGYFNVSGNDVWMEVQYGIQGQTNFTDEVHIPIGGGVLVKGTTGVRFRNFVAGSPAVVTAALSEKTEPPIQIAATGQSSTGSTTSAMQLIQTLGPLAVPQASFDFAAIPATFKHLLIVGQARSTNASPSQLIQMRFNADVGANYDYNEAFNRTAGVGNRVAAANGFFVVGEASAALDAAASASPLEISIPNYSLNTLRKQFRAKGWAKNNGDADATNFMILDAAGEWRSAAIINEVTLFQPAGNFDIGSLFSLYGLQG